MVLFLRYKRVKLGLPLRVVLSDIVCFVFAIKRLMLGSPLHVVLCGNSDREACGRESLLSAPSTWKFTDFFFVNKNPELRNVTYISWGKI